MQNPPRITANGTLGPGDAALVPRYADEVQDDGGVTISARQQQNLGVRTARAAILSVLPLGAGAIAGANFNTDREMVANKLAFDSVAPNSMDAVANRDWARVTQLAKEASERVKALRG